jgi:RNA polymerase sigma factor (sigma-70 family)
MEVVAQRASLDADSWDALFDFLDAARPAKQGADRDREAEARYVEITRKLVFFFTGRACGDAEDLALETILRVARKCRQIGTDYEDRTGYFYGVARNVLHEWQRDSRRESTKREFLRQELDLPAMPAVQSWMEQEAVHACLDKCVTELPQQTRHLIQSYYSSEKAAKIDSHRRLAEGLGKSVNALRIEVHRIRKTLRACVFACMQAEAGAPAYA